MKAPLLPFQDWLEHYQEKHRALSAQSQFIGYFCTYTPVEMIHAAGFIPVRILGESGSLEKAPSLVPSFICHYMRRTLEKALEEKYAYLSGLVQAYTCDVACGLINIWAENIRLDFYHTLPLPYNRTPEARTYFRSILQEFIEKLNAHGGRLSWETLDQSLQLYRRIRKLLWILYQKRAAGRLNLSAKDVLTVVLAGFVTPPETYCEHLEILVQDLSNDERMDGPKGFPVLVSGSLLENLSIMDALETLGFRIVADDLCSGLRSFYPVDGQGDDPLDRLIDRTVHHFPCPSRHRARDRFPLLMDLVRGAGAQGVIFLPQKFCTPHLADYPLLAEALNKEGLPHILLEMEDSGLTEAHRTRLEAFLEIHGCK
jgi:benzoyl-CoA reductase/2-hydroxyglutaryl-CoA dehydratase subunit BcrC/BadD/HgdB